MGKFHDRMDRELRIRGYSNGTRRLYLSCVRTFVRHFMRPPDELALEHVKRYQLHLTRTRKVSWSTFNTHVCALRFFYGEVLRVDWEIHHIPYQKTGRKLPQILSGVEVCNLFRATPNVKYRTILMTLYGAGLRLSEGLHLRVRDIDSPRMVIRIEQGKGRKDRYVMLSERLLSSLRDYWRQARPPSAWLFCGRPPERPLSRRPVYDAFQRAVEDAGITKKVTIHTLRHSFATHLMERGVSIRVIQRLLGHKSLRSTEIYTHVAGSYLQDTRSPLDDLLPVNASVPAADA